MFYGFLQRAGLRKVRFHDLRHTFCLAVAATRREPHLREGADGPFVHPGYRRSLGYLIPGGNKQAVDRLDSIPDMDVELGKSATNPQPAVWSAPMSIPNPLHYPMVANRGDGVSDGFRTRDLRIHNPAL